MVGSKVSCITTATDTCVMLPHPVIVKYLTMNVIRNNLHKLYDKQTKHQNCKLIPWSIVPLSLGTLFRPLFLSIQQTRFVKRGLNSQWCVVHRCYVFVSLHFLIVCQMLPPMVERASKYRHSISQFMS